MTKKSPWIIGLLLVVASAVLAQDAPPANSTAVEKGITRPSESIEFQFNQPGLIREVIVKEGDRVKKGDVLVQQDDSVEQEWLKGKEIEANSDLSTRLAKAKLDVLKVDLERKKALFAQQNVSQSELEEAQLKVIEAELDKEYSEQKQQTAKLDVAEQKARIALKKIVCTFDGTVQKVDARAGQNADPSKPQVTVVRNDRLWIDVHAPAPKTKSLKEKQTLQVRYDGEEQWEPAEIIFLDPVVDAQSDTQLVRLQVKNGDARRSGLRVDVRLPDNIAAAASAK